MTDCRTCGALDCINVDDYDVYSLQQPSVIAASQSGRIAISDIADAEFCSDESLSFNVTASGDSIDGYSEWSVLGGSFPSGLILESHGSYATISGTPTTPGDYIFSLLVESTNGDRAAKVFELEIIPCYDDCVTTVESETLTTVAVTSYTRSLSAGQLIRMLIDALADCYVEVYAPSGEFVGVLDAGTIDDAYFIPVETGNYRFDVYTDAEDLPKEYELTLVVCSLEGTTLTGELTGIPPDEDFYSNGNPTHVYEFSGVAGQIVILPPVIPASVFAAMAAAVIKSPYDPVSDQILVTGGTYDSVWVTLPSTGTYKIAVSELAAQVPAGYSFTYHVFTP